MKGLKGLTQFSVMSFTTSEAREVSHEGLDCSGLESVNRKSLLLSMLQCYHDSTLYVLCV